MWIGTDLTHSTAWTPSFLWRRLFAENSRLTSLLQRAAKAFPTHKPEKTRWGSREGHRSNPNLNRRSSFQRNKAGFYFEAKSNSTTDRTLVLPMRADSAGASQWKLKGTVSPKYGCCWLKGRFYECSFCVSLCSTRESCPPSCSCQSALLLLLIHISADRYITLP